MDKTVVDFAEKRLEEISPQEMSLHLMRLPAKKRLELILQREDAESVVAAMAEQDFYVSVKEIGADDSLSLLALASVEQLNHLFDLEWWRKDRIQSARAVDWLDRLGRASENKLLEWLYYADFELLVVLFKQWLRVVMAPDDIDLAELRDQLPKNTLDDQYFWETLYPQYEDFFRQFLGVIYEINYDFYKELMNHIIWALDVEIEEGAYRFHRGRLEDQVIPDFYDALNIYRSMAPEDVEFGKSVWDSGSSTPTPSFALAVISERDLLGRALQEIKDPLLINTLKWELASLSNKVIVADQLSPDNPEALRMAVDKAAAYVNLGLHLLGGDAVEAALSHLRELFLENLFRLGHTRVMRLRNRLQSIRQQGWISRWPNNLNCLDPDWMESAELLLGKTPRILRSSDTSQGRREDFFRNSGDLSKGEHFIDVVESLGKVFEALAPNPEYLETVLWEEAQISDLADVTVGNMLWTAAASFQVQGRWEVEPLSVELWLELFPLLNADKMKQLIRSWIDRYISDPEVSRHLEAYLAPLLMSYEEEMAPFDDAHPPDPRLVKYFLFKE